MMNDECGMMNKRQRCFHSAFIIPHSSFRIHHSAFIISFILRILSIHVDSFFCVGWCVEIQADVQIG